MPSMATPDLRAVNRYRNSVNCDFTPYRSETPEIPTRPKDAKETVRLPAVENRNKLGREIRRNKSPGPYETQKKNQIKFDYFPKNKIGQNLRKVKF